MSAKQFNLSEGELDKLVKANKSKKGQKARAAAERRRIAEWAEVLKDDHDFDYGCILNIFAYKLKRTREHIVSHNIVADAGNIGRQIQRVEDLIAQVLDENGYYKRILNPVEIELDKKYGKVIYSSKKLPDGLIESTSRRKNTTPKEEKAANKAWLAAYRRAGLARQRDIQRAFTLMAKNILTWWD